MQCRTFLLMVGATVLTMLAPTSAQDLGKADSSTNSCQVTREEVGVYAALLGPSSDAVTVLVTSTEARDYGIDDRNLQLAAQGRGLPPELRFDFKNKNKLSCGIKPFSSPRDLRFISKAENNAMFARGWAAFHEKYGNNSEILAISRVGFSADKNLALLHTIEGSGQDAVAGELVLFERKNGRWQIKWRVQTVA